MLNRLAFTELKLGNNHNVMQSFARALAQSPGELLATVMLARAKLSQSDFTGAEEEESLRRCAQISRCAQNVGLILSSSEPNRRHEN